MFFYKNIFDTYSFHTNKSALAGNDKLCKRKSPFFPSNSTTRQGEL